MPLFHTEPRPKKSAKASAHLRLIIMINVKNKFDILYISKSRLHRNKANLIQTLNTVDALHQIGLNIKIFFPPTYRNVNINKKLYENGLSGNINISTTQFLHSRWKSINYKPFFYIHKKELCNANAVYVRSIDLSKELINQKIIHNLEIHNIEDFNTEKKLTKIISGHVNKIINYIFPISQTIKDFLIQHGADDNRIIVSRNGVNYTSFSNIRKFNPHKNGNWNIGYIGTISHTRGLSILEKIAQQLDDVVYVTGKKENKISKSSKLIYNGLIPHSFIVKHYEKLDILLLPYQESLPHALSISPIKLFEGMAAGRPIIASDLPPIREIITNKHNGLLVPPDDVNQWISAINFLKKNSNFSKKIALNAQKCAKEYSWHNRALRIARAIGLNTNN